MNKRNGEIIGSIAKLGIIFGVLVGTPMLIDSVRFRLYNRKMWNALTPRDRNTMRMLWEECGANPETMVDALHVIAYRRTDLDGTTYAPKQDYKRREELIYGIRLLRKKLETPLEDEGISVKEET